MSPRTAVIVTIGRRKTAIARLKLTKKSEDGLHLKVNDQDYKTYFPYFDWHELLTKPLKMAGVENFEAIVKVSGGGQRSQAEAVRHAIARALVVLNPEAKAALRKEGYITRDPREKERMKPGLKKARRAPQWSKR